MKHKFVRPLRPGPQGKCSIPERDWSAQSRNKADSLTLAVGSLPIPFKTPLRDAELYQSRVKEFTEYANKVAISLTWKE